MQGILNIFGKVTTNMNRILSKYLLKVDRGKAPKYKTIKSIVYQKTVYFNIFKIYIFCIKIIIFSIAKSDLGDHSVIAELNECSANKMWH